MNYWVDKGVDGFRLDVINLISKDESQYYVDSTIKGHQVCANGPHIHEYIQEMNQKVFSRKELLTVGETPAVTIEDAKKYAPLDNKELSMVFQFELMNVDGAEVNKWTDLGILCSGIIMINHDVFQDLVILLLLCVMKNQQKCWRYVYI